MTGSDPDLIFAALGDPTRRFLIERLARDGGASATSLADELPISRQAVAKHLETLRAADLVNSERRGRETTYSLDTARLDEVSAWVSSVGAQWDRRLARLKSMLDRDASAG